MELQLRMVYAVPYDLALHRTVDEVQQARPLLCFTGVFFFICLCCILLFMIFPALQSTLDELQQAPAYCSSRASLDWILMQLTDSQITSVALAIATGKLTACHSMAHCCSLHTICPNKMLTILSRW